MWNVQVSLAIERLADHLAIALEAQYVPECQEEYELKRIYSVVVKIAQTSVYPALPKSKHYASARLYDFRPRSSSRRTAYWPSHIADSVKLLRCESSQRWIGSTTSKK